MSIVKYVRGNTMLLTVTLTEKHEEGDPTVVDVEAYDSWAANVYRCGSVAKSKVGGVVTGVDTEKRVTLLLPPKLGCGVYSVEIVLTKEDIGRRSFEIPVFEVVETNGEADITYELIDGMRSADIDMQFQFVEVDAILGENAYEEWKKLPGHEDKTLQDFIDEVRVPAGGSTGQILRKKSDNDYDTEWVDDEGGGKQSDWNETDTTDPAYIKNKPTIPAAQVQSDWNQTSSSAKDYIKNKPTIPDVSNKADKATTLAGYGITDAKIESGVITLGSNTITPVTDISGKQDVIDSSHKLSADLVSDGSTNKVFTATEQSKLSGIAAGAEVNVQANWNESDTSSDAYIQNKPTIPDVSNCIQKSNTAGLVKNDGTIDTNTYLTSHQDISGKEDKVDIVSASGATLSAEVGKYYTLSNVGTLAITLPTIAAGTTKVQTVTFYIAAGSTPAVTFTSTHSIYYSDGFEIAADTTYEVSAAYNGIAWVVASVKIVIPT